MVPNHVHGWHPRGTVSDPGPVPQQDVRVAARAAAESQLHRPLVSGCNFINI